MEYSFIDPSMSLLEATLHAAMGAYAPTQSEEIPELEIPAATCELDESWNNFETILSEFKVKYRKAVQEYKMQKKTVESINKKTYIARLITERVDDETLRTKLLSVIESDEMEEKLAEHIAECSKKQALVAEMKRIMEDTHAEEYARYMCPICTERGVDLFMDPCGHVICEPCQAKIVTRDRGKCPVCRTLLRGSRKMYTI